MSVEGLVVRKGLWCDGCRRAGGVMSVEVWSMGGQVTTLHPGVDTQDPACSYGWSLTCHITCHITCHNGSTMSCNMSPLH